MNSVNESSLVSVLTDGPTISSPCFRRNMTPEKRGSVSIYCRICHEDGSLEELIEPCECSGTVALIHSSCLEKWLSTSNTDRCEICKYTFSLQKKDKPLSQWWKSKNVNGPQGVAGDVICLVVLTPLCIAATYLCSIGATAYIQLGFWEGTGLAVLSCMLIATYCLWLLVTLRFHYKSWKQWRKRNQDVKLLVKHKTTESISVRSPMNEQNRNNNDDNNISRTIIRFATWFGISLSINGDAVYSAEQQTSLIV